MVRLVALLLFSVFAFTSAEEVEPGTLQAKQALRFVTALDAASSPCSPALMASENTFACAIVSLDASTFRSIIDREAAASDLKSIGPWAAYQGEVGQQRSFLYKDGFMTITFFPAEATREGNLMVVQYVIPHD